MRSHVFSLLESVGLVWSAQFRKITGGKIMSKAGLIDMNAERQLGQVAMNARRSRVKPNRTMMEYNSPSGMSAQPGGPSTMRSFDMVVLEIVIRLMFCITSTSNSRQQKEQNL